MSRRISVDLDDVGDLERIWQQLQRAHAARNADPQLREAILRRVDEALADGRLTDAQAAQIRRQLDELHPALVLDAHWRKIIKDRPSLGAFPRRTRETPQAIEAWLADDPRRVICVMAEMGRFTTDEVKILQAVSDLVDAAQIPDDVAHEVALEGLRQLRQSWHNAAKGPGRAS